MKTFNAKIADLKRRIDQVSAIVPRYLACIVFACVASAQGPDRAVAQNHFKVVSIDNGHPRRDIDSNILDAHDGSLMCFGGKYYLYGTSYGHMTDRSEGLGKTFVVYSSPNMQDWTYNGMILRHAPKGIHFRFSRPRVVYNTHTLKYVLWFNTVYVTGSKWQSSKYAVATADGPEGPFTVINNDVPLYGSEPGDLSLFVDSDGTSYATYSYDPQQLLGDPSKLKRAFAISSEPIPFSQIAVEQLAADYLSGTGHVTAPIAGNSEAPALFRRGNLYYLMFDNTCAFCNAGTGVRVYIAQRPLGPYIYKGNINRVGAQSRDLPSPWTPPGTGRPDAIIKAQQTHVAVLPGPVGDQYLWMGDRLGVEPG